MLVWDYRTGDIIDPETGVVVGRIYVAEPWMALRRAWSSESAGIVHHSPMTSPRRVSRRRRGSRIRLVRPVEAVRREALERVLPRARRVLGPSRLRAVEELYRRLEERGFQWFIRGRFIARVATRLAFLAVLLHGCSNEIAAAFGVSLSELRRLCALAEEFMKNRGPARYATA